MIKYASVRVCFLLDFDCLILSPINFNFLMKQPLDFAVANSE